MKTLTSSLFAALAVTGTALAGPAPVGYKDFKEVTVPPAPYFRGNELSLDFFYSFNDADHEGSRSETTVNERHFVIPQPIDPTITDTTVRSRPQYFHDGSGGGVGLNYFFTRYIGVDVEGNWWDGVETGERVRTTRGVIVDDNGHVLNSGRTTTRGSINRSAANQVTGNLILRYPFEGRVAWAPYIFGGGGGIWDGSGAGFGDVGAGAEVRLTHHFGLFSDWRWNFMGGNHNDVSTTRLGVRFIF